MVYSVVSQVDNDLVSDAPRSPEQLEPHAASPSSPLAQHNESTGDDPAGSTPTIADFGLGRLGSILRSMTDASYDILEGDDYEAAEPLERPSSLRLATSLEASFRAANSVSPEPQLRSPSAGHPVSLSHPTPDLQSLQGAYVGNVERLERTAERLSTGSTDIDREIHKIDLEQEKQSNGSLANPIAVGDNLPQIASPEPGHERDPPNQSHHISPTSSPQSLTSSHRESSLQGDQKGQYDTITSGGKVERHSTITSTDTYQQSKRLFADFDGVHFVTNEDVEGSSRNVSLTRPPLASGSQSHKEPQSGENMVYYPAPIPMTLNLPPRLSNKPAKEREKRQTQAFGVALPKNKKQVQFPSFQMQDEKGRRPNKMLANLPPQLRASKFFEPPPLSFNMQPTQASAVEMFESILDASARAPVTAFTDHPFAGHLGSGIYGSTNTKALQKEPANKINKLRSRSAAPGHSTLQSGLQPTADLERTRAHTASVDGNSTSHSDASSSGSQDDDYGSESSTDEATDSVHSWSDQELEDNRGNQDYVGPPNTLLAELQSRKEELKQRRRTAANTAGLHSTLLELDTVAQKYSERRRQKRVTLAWESVHDSQSEDEDNEDIPLALLYPNKVNLPAHARSIGLLEKREMEDTEPLSQRRARLRGENPAISRGPRANEMSVQDDEPAVPSSEDEGETLGERRRRLKAENHSSVAAESEFTAEILAEIDNLRGDEGGDDNDEDGAQEEETLAQRRVRLQMEAKREQPINSEAQNTRKSMAELSEVRPRPATISRQLPAQRQTFIGIHTGETQVRMRAPFQYGPAQSVEYIQYPNYATAVRYSNTPNRPNTFYSDTMPGMNSLPYAMSGGDIRMPRPIIEPGQREMINRWRQSIK